MTYVKICVCILIVAGLFGAHSVISKPKRLTSQLCILYFTLSLHILDEHLALILSLKESSVLL